MSDELDPGAAEHPVEEPSLDSFEEPAVEEHVAEPGPRGQIPPFREVAEIHRPSTPGGILFLSVLATALVGVGITATGAWRQGVSWLAAALIAAAVARVVLRDDHAGMLHVRNKVLDAVILTVTGALLLVLAWTIPDQPVR